jgi:hypothetical protein
MANQKRNTFNPKKEVSVMAWIWNDEGDVLLVRQTAGQKLIVASSLGQELSVSVTGQSMDNSER